MRKRLTAAALAGTIGVAGLTGFAVIGNSMVANAATESPSGTATEDGTTTEDGTATENGTTRPDPVSRILAALQGLVGDGTITDEQAQEVADTLADELPGRDGGHHMGMGGPGGGGMGGPGGGGRVDLGATVAGALGLSEDEVDTALRDGTTIAELAEQESVEVDTVVAALVAAAETELDQAVASGDIDQARADEVSATLTERFTSLVEDGRGGPRGPRGSATTENSSTTVDS